MQSKDFQGLIEDLAAGREEAAAWIVARYSGALATVARRRIGNKLGRRVDPDDIVQSAYRSFFVRANKGEYTLESERDLWRLLVTVMLNKLRSRARYHTAERRSIDLEQSALAAAGPPPAELRRSQEPGPEEAAVLVEEVQAFLARLDPRDRQIAELKLQGHSNSEIAQAIGRTERSVRRALQHFRKQLERKASP